MDLKDCRLQFPDVTTVDHLKHCPKYTNIGNRRKDDGVSFEELDPLQMELEQLLAAASQRMRQLKSELATLSDLQENKKEKKVSRGKDFEHKRSRIVEDRPVKKMKTSDGSPHVLKPPGSHLNSSTSSPSGMGRSKAKGSSLSKLIETESVDEPPVPQRSAEVPNKFWQMVDSYCGPISQETVSLLEKMEKPISDEYFEIPALGKHFSQVWAEEDLAIEEKEGCRSSENNLKSSVEKIMKKTMENLNDSEPCPFGTFTQRLISSFVQENIIAPPESGSGNDGKSFDALMNNNDQNTVSKTNKATSLPHTSKLEARLKAELIEQGIIDTSSSSDKDDDEVLTELKRCQQELHAISDRNRTVVSQLLKLVKDDMKKQDLRKSIESANSDVTEHYRKVAAARQKKRNLMKKEKESAMKALKERENLVKQLEQLN